MEEVCYATARSFFRLPQLCLLTGTGVYGWQTDEEEDLWEIDLNFSGLELDEPEAADFELT